MAAYKASQGHLHAPIKQLNKFFITQISANQHHFHSINLRLIQLKAKATLKCFSVTVRLSSSAGAERQRRGGGPHRPLSAPVSDNNLHIKSKMNQLFSISVTVWEHTVTLRRRRGQLLLKTLCRLVSERKNCRFYGVFLSHLIGRSGFCSVVCC